MQLIKQASLQLLIIGTVTFTLLEVSSRLLFFQPVMTPYKRVHTNGLIGNPSNDTAYFGWFGRPVIKYVYGTYQNRISSLQYPKKNYMNDGTHNFLVLGDSHSFGTLVEHEKSFVSLIEQDLNSIKICSEPINFINSSSGGWGLADYSRYINYMQGKLPRLSGIIIFINADDARRAVYDHVYNGNSAEINRSTNEIVLTVKKNILNSRLFMPIYSWTLRNFNTVRLVKNLFIYGTPLRPIVSTPSIGSFPSQKTQQVIPNTVSMHAYIVRAIDELSKAVDRKIPVISIYIGTASPDSLSLHNRQFIGRSGVNKLRQAGLNPDFSLIEYAPVYGVDGIIKHEGHPNEKGHSILNDKIIKHTKITSFVSKNCLMK